MARYLKGEDRERFALANHTIETCAEFLSDPRINVATKGLADRALYLLSLLYVPNNSDNVYQVTGKEQDGNGIPFIIASPGEKPKVHRNSKYTLHPLQHDGLYASMNTIEQKQLTTKQFEKRLDLIRESYDDAYGNKINLGTVSTKWDAFVASYSSAIGLDQGKKTKTKAYLLQTNPIIVGNIESLPSDEGSVLFHEIVHVNQNLSGKLFLDKSRELKDEKYRCELEAYWAQATALEIYLDIPVVANSEFNSFGVESARREINTGEDPFRVSRALLEAIKRNGSILR